MDDREKRPITPHPEPDTTEAGVEHDTETDLDPEDAVALIEEDRVERIEE